MIFYNDKDRPKLFNKYKIDLKIEKVIIILSTQRSGSSMICKDLDMTNQLGHPDEYFINIITKLKESKYNLSREEIQANINKILLKTSTDNKVVSLKAMSSYFHEIGKLFSDKIEQPKKWALLDLNYYFYQDIFYYFFKTISKEVFFVRVYRKDKVRQAISRLLSQTTGFYHREINRTKVAKEIYGPEGLGENFNLEKHYSYNQINQIINNIYKEENLLDLFLLRNDIKPFLVFYEDVVGDFSYLHKLGKFIKLDTEINLPQTRNIEKLSNNINEDIYNRFSNDGGFQKNLHFFGREIKYLLLRNLFLSSNFSNSR